MLDRLSCCFNIKLKAFFFTNWPQVNLPLPPCGYNLVIASWKKAWNDLRAFTLISETNSIHIINDHLEDYYDLTKESLTKVLNTCSNCSSSFWLCFAFYQYIEHWKYCCCCCSSSYVTFPPYIFSQNFSWFFLNFPIFPPKFSDTVYLHSHPFYPLFLATLRWSHVQNPKEFCYWMIPLSLPIWWTCFLTPFLH